MIDFFVVVLINNYRWINWFLMIDINYDVIEDLKINYLICLIFVFFSN